MVAENRSIAAKASSPYFETDKHTPSIELDLDPIASLLSGSTLIATILGHTSLKGRGVCGERR
jgi:hypothetical protein